MADNNQDQLPENSENTDLPGSSDTNHTDQDQVQNDLDSVHLTFMVKVCPDHLINTVQTAIDKCLELGYVFQNQNQKSKYISKVPETNLKNFIDENNATNNASGTNHTDQDKAQNDLDSVYLTLMVKACPDHLINTVQNVIDICMNLGFLTQNQESEYIIKVPETNLKNFIDEVNATNNAAKSEPVNELETEAETETELETNKVSIEMAKPVDAEAAGRRRHKKRQYNLRPRKPRFVEQLNKRRKNRRKAGNNGRRARNTHYGPVCRRCRRALADPEISFRQIVARRKANNRRKAGRPTHPRYGRGHHGRRGGRGDRGGRGRPVHN